MTERVQNAKGPIHGLRCTDTTRPGRCWRTAISTANNRFPALIIELADPRSVRSRETGYGRLSSMRMEHLESGLTPKATHTPRIAKPLAPTAARYDKLTSARPSILYSDMISVHY